jgi:hypothetical protein
MTSLYGKSPPMHGFGRGLVSQLEPCRTKHTKSGNDRCIQTALLSMYVCIDQIRIRQIMSNPYKDAADA